MKRPIAIVTLFLLALVMQPRVASAGLLDQVDTFENGTTQNWVINLLGMGSPPAVALPVNVPSGGPAGIDDNFLRLTAIGGEGAGSRLTVINTTQWAGNYLGEGVVALTMDLRNFGQTDLSLRLLFGAGAGGPPTDVAVSMEAVVLRAGGDWTSVVFPVRPADLTALTGSVTNALSNAFELRLYHSPVVGFPGPPVVASLGVDNIRARAVPEPSSAVVLGIGLSMLVGWVAWPSTRTS